MGSNPLEVPKLFFGLICNCLNCDYHCSHDQIFIQNLYLESKVQDFLGFPQGPMIPLHGANSTRCKNHKIIFSTLQNRKHVRHETQFRLRPFLSFSLLTTKLQLIIFLISLQACLAVPRSLCYPRISAEINSKSRIHFENDVFRCRCRRPGC